MSADAGQVVIAVMVAAAVYTWLGSEPQLSRLQPITSTAARRWWQGRADALGWRVRLGCGLVAGLAVASVVTQAYGLVLAAVVTVVVVWALSFVEPGRVRADRRRQLAQLPAVLDLMTAALQAGMAPRTAATVVAEVVEEPSRTALQVVSSQIDVGRSDSQAWLSLASQPRFAQVWGRVARDLARSSRSGMAVVEVLRIQADSARQVRRAALEQQARTVGVRSVLPLVVCFLPAFVLIGVVPIVAGMITRYWRGF